MPGASTANLNSFQLKGTSDHSLYLISFSNNLVRRKSRDCILQRSIAKTRTVDVSAIFINVQEKLREAQKKSVVDLTNCIFLAKEMHQNS
ncbi:unnamed protein product [Thlaspi arvense]|uniref:Uncharacterized protein n=1 Tax=Thlaspi arvense TaxID=13288 RepID=A0AAU9SHK4_THLAR|nr:unnamed protein product [Thlaspi arvense]